MSRKEAAKRSVPPESGLVLSRRTTLAGMAALWSCPAGLAQAGSGAEALHRVCLEVVHSTDIVDLGLSLAGGRSVRDIETALLARAPDATDRAEWHMALLELGRSDMAEGATCEAADSTLTRAEADMLALGALLRRQGMRSV